MVDKMKKDYAKIAIILLNYNNYNDTINCIESLKKVDYPNFFVIVVDNNSTNDSFAYLKKMENDKIKIINSGKNGGFAFGNNVGIKLALEQKAEYVLLLNNDTIVTPNFLTKLEECFLIKNNVGIVTSRIMYNKERDKIWYAGGDIDWDNLRATHEGINQSIYKKHEMREVNFASGCCMLISSECLRNVGGLPEDYFMYCEDMDYCVKVRECGYKIIYDSDSVIYHCVSSAGGGEESPFVIEWSNRARRKFYKKYKDYIRFYKRGYIYIKCEMRMLAKIFVGKNRRRALAAYKKSFIKK